MEGFALEIALFVALTAMALLLFASWAVAVTARGIWRAVGLLCGSWHSAGFTGPTARCSRLRCGAYNPADANFCRRCGALTRRAVATNCGRVAA